MIPPDPAVGAGEVTVGVVDVTVGVNEVIVGFGVVTVLVDDVLFPHVLPLASNFTINISPAVPFPKDWVKPAAAKPPSAVCTME